MRSKGPGQPKSRSLLAYNTRILIGGNYWLLAVPIVVSQVTLGWHMAVTTTLNPAVIAQIAEMETSLLAAFLAAFLFAPEFRGRVGSVIAAKPFSPLRTLWLRMAVAGIYLAGVMLFTMAVYRLALYKEFNIGLTLAAAVPSALFMAGVSLWLSAIFRSPLPGFLCATIFWLLDLAWAGSAHPLLSLQTYKLSLEKWPLAEKWWISKLVLTALGLGILWLAARALILPEKLKSARRLRRQIAALAAAVFLYIFTGAAVKVFYGYTHAGALAGGDHLWFIRQFEHYGSFSVARLFGSAFADYVGYRPPGQRSRSRDEVIQAFRADAAHVARMRRVVRETPGSMWAPHAALALGDTLAQRPGQMEEALAVYQKHVDLYPNSPLTPLALEGLAKAADDLRRYELSLEAAERLVDRFPRHPAAYRRASRSAERLRESDPRRAAALLEKAAVSAPAAQAPALHWFIGELKQQIGDRDGARESYRRALAAVPAAQRALDPQQWTGRVPDLLRLQDSVRDIKAQAEKRIQALGG